jgi:lysylphosphatidylglycerol synthetase-like protein (DUF2156 family)
LPALLGAFGRAMRAEHRSVCLLVVSEHTARTAIELGFSALKIGEEPWFDLAHRHTPRGNRGKKYRWAANHARRMGVEVEEYRPNEVRNIEFESEVTGRACALARCPEKARVELLFACLTV